jgi:hypothetical protein
MAYRGKGHEKVKNFPSKEKLKSNDIFSSFLERRKRCLTVWDIVTTSNAHPSLLLPGDAINTALPISVGATRYKRKMYTV